MSTVLILPSSLVIFSLIFLLWRQSWKKYPPGPQPWPIIENWWDMPVQRSWLRFTEWKDTYGDLVYLRVLGQPILILNSIEAVQDLFEKRSSVYSDRPRRVMGELCGFGRTLAFRNDDSTVRTSRKLLHSELNPRAMVGHERTLEQNAQNLCVSNITSPEHFLTNIRKMAVANIMMIAYGHVTDENSDDLVSMAQEVMQYLGTAMTTHKYLVDALPFLRFVPSWFPGASFQRTAAASRATLKNFYDLPFERIVNQMKSGTYYPSLVSSALQSDLSPEERDILKATAGEMYGAGTDTNVSVISSFFLAMVLNPEIQRRGRQEIFAVVGKERLPRLSDKNSLPFVAAIVQECLRWNPSVPLAGHCSRIPDTYRGYHIPARTLVIANAWGLLHDENRYIEPMRFDPDRYLRDPKPPKATDFTFGFGRRSCPGSDLAHSTIFIAIATTLATCNIAPCVNADGVPVLAEVIYTSAAFSQPYPFKCEISVVSDEAMKLLSDAPNDMSIPY